jgi:hypothetical protein
MTYKTKFIQYKPRGWEKKPVIRQLKDGTYSVTMPTIRGLYTFRAKTLSRVKRYLKNYEWT